MSETFSLNSFGAGFAVATGIALLLDGYLIVAILVLLLAAIAVVCGTKP